MSADTFSTDTLAAMRRAVAECGPVLVTPAAIRLPLHVSDACRLAEDYARAMGSPLVVPPSMYDQLVAAGCDPAALRRNEPLPLAR